MQGIPIIVSAASGTGKTSLVKALVASISNLCVSISYTTRPMRPGEEEGINYRFVTKEAFEQLIQQNVFIEYANVFGNYYGTSRAWVDEQLEQRLDVIFEIDWQGARQLRQQWPSVISIFILPPSLAILEERLKQRGQDDAIIISKRMNEARNEIAHYPEFDYLVVNDNFAAALEDLQSIIRGSRLRRERSQPALAELLAKLSL